MKKLAVIFLLLTYGFTTMGATIHIHYCMNKFVDASFWHSNADKCGTCGMKGKVKEKCCKDEHKQFKLKTDHSKTNVPNAYCSIAIPILLPPSVYYLINIPVEKVKNYTNYRPPPNIYIQNVQVLYCTFLI